MRRYVEEGCNRIVQIHENGVYKIPKDWEAIFQNQLEAIIFERSKSKILAECKLIDNHFLEMVLVKEDVSRNNENVYDDRLTESQFELIKKHKLEYGFTNNQLQVYDYGDIEIDWSREKPEDLFLDDLVKIN